MRKISALALVLLMAWSVGCSDQSGINSVQNSSSGLELQADDDSKGGRATTRPFRGTWETTFTQPGDPVPGCDGDPDTGVFIIEGIGNATHMGRTTYLSESESDFVNQCGNGMIIAANGDQLEVEFEGTVDASGFPAITFTGGFTFTGGTGRFENATGNGTFDGSGDAFLGQGEVTYIGTVTY